VEGSVLDDGAAQQDPLAMPLSVYEVHLGSWIVSCRQGNPLADLFRACHKAHPIREELWATTHVELLPITEYPFDGLLGLIKTTGYFAVTSGHGSPEDFMAFVDTAHQAGIGVLMDWTPAHFPKRSAWARPV